MFQKNLGQYVLVPIVPCVNLALLMDITQNCVKLLIYITKNLLGTADLQNTVFTYTYNSGEMIRQVMMFVTKTMSTLLHVPQTN